MIKKLALSAICFCSAQMYGAALQRPSEPLWPCGQWHGDSIESDHSIVLEDRALRVIHFCRDMIEMCKDNPIDNQFRIKAIKAVAEAEDAVGRLKGK